MSRCTRTGPLADHFQPVRYAGREFLLALGFQIGRAVFRAGRSNPVVNPVPEFLTPFCLAGGTPPISSLDEEIIQRIPPPELSDRVKASRMASDDSELVVRSQRGETAAFEELVRQHQHMVHALTYRMTGSLADAEDLAQEAFLRAYEQLGDFRGTARFSTWLYRIAVNVCLNWRQSEARRQRLYAQAAVEFSAQHDGGGDSPAGPGGEVQAALLKLPAQQRAAIVLTIYDGLNPSFASTNLNHCK
jgi:RNA polymerase sigma-70 factor (ECF subfamily)